jgi:hypothetical protein
MGHLRSRGWDVKAEHISDAQADEFKARMQMSHTARWEVDITRFRNVGGVGTIQTLAQNIPITGGTLTLDSSDPIRRRLSLEVSGGSDWDSGEADWGDVDWEPDDAAAPLTPFGQWATLFVVVDKIGGGNFPRFQVFTGPIRSVVWERPSQIMTVEATDPSQTVADYLHIRRRTYKDLSVKQVVSQLVNDALPNALYNVDANAHSEDAMIRFYTAEAGEPRWDTCLELAGRRNLEPFFDAWGDVCIRKDITDEDDTFWDPSEPGGDIGDVANPVCKFRDGEAGNLLGITSTLTREGAVNGAIITATFKEKEGDSNRTPLSTIETGPMAWSDRFGRVPLVESRTYSKRPSDFHDVMQKRTRKLLRRRGGMLRYHDFDSLPQYHAEPDDKVSITVNGRTENHYLSSVEFDLTGGPMRCRTRTISTGTLATEAES